MRIDTPFFKADVRPTFDSDAIDRLRYFATVLILCSCALFIMAKQYVGESVQCWAPRQFKKGWEVYAETYCLIENTYHVGMNATNLPTPEQRNNQKFRYYQWVPFILFFLAMALYIPRLVWRILQSLSGTNISIVTANLRKNAISGLDQKKEDDKFSVSKLTICMLSTKVLAVLVLIGSMVFLDFFMGLGPMYGWTVTKQVLQGKQWQESGTFPRVTFCDFEVRELGYVNNWSLQCVLMVNMFNEKLFIALWWWYLVLLCLSIFDLFAFLFRFTVHHQVKFISRILACHTDEPISTTAVGEFNRRVLKIDGINLMHLIYSNATIFEAAEFLSPTWENFAKDKKW
uniref:Innexin n=1 Tax=Caenorhabditis japonica TaxID=281687 RepID=A0A8R1HKB0_CAEJA